MSPPGLSSASVTVPRPRPRRAARTAPCQRDPHSACRPGPRLPVPSFPAPCVGHTSLVPASSGDSSPQFADWCREPPPVWTGGLRHTATSGSHQNGASQRGPRISRHWTTHHTGGHRAEAPGDDSALGPAGTNPVVSPCVSGCKLPSLSLFALVTPAATRCSAGVMTRCQDLTAWWPVGTSRGACSLQPGSMGAWGVTVVDRQVQLFLHVCVHTCPSPPPAPA